MWFEILNVTVLLPRKTSILSRSKISNKVINVHECDWILLIHVCVKNLFLSFCSQRYETLLKDMEKKSEQHREVLSSLQQELQKAQGLAVGKV